MACVQNHAIPHKISHNRLNLLDMVREAATHGARLIVTPEMGVTGYVYDHPDQLLDYAETVPGPTSEAFLEVAREFGIYISIGFAEKGPYAGICYNSFVLVGPTGVLHVYRKVQLAADDTLWAVPGGEIKPMDLEFGRVGSLICADVGFGEIPRLLALQGCEVVQFPMAWSGTKLPADPYFRTRALESGCYMLVSNVVGRQGNTDFYGNSMIVGTDGEVLVRGSLCEEDIIYAELELSKVNDAQKAAISGRRPELYSELLRKSFYWQQPSLLKLPPGRAGWLKVAGYLPSEMGIQECVKTIEELATSSLADRSSPLILVLPPYTLTGAPSDACEAREFGAQWDLLGSTLARIARQTNSCIVGSGVQVEGDRLCHSAIVASYEGGLCFVKSTHLSPRELCWATPGDRIEYVDLPHARLGIMLGDEIMFPEVSRTLSKFGCDVQCCLWDERMHRAAPSYVAMERANTSTCYIMVSRASTTVPAVIAGNLDGRVGPQEFAESDGQAKAVWMEHDRFDGSWIRQKVRLGRLMEHVYGPLVTPIRTSEDT